MSGRLQKLPIAHVFWATRASLMANSEDRRRAVARSEVRVAVEGLCRTSFTSQEDLPALDPLADARGPEATVPVGADAEGAVAITVLGPGDPAPAYHYRQPFSQPLADTRKETGAVVTPRGVVASIGLRVRHRLVGCSKLCFSPIGAILVICSCSLLYCVAEIFSPPPFGINTGANGAECNATGFEPMPICICPRETVCVKDFKSLAFLALARCAANSNPSPNPNPSPNLCS